MIKSASITITKEDTNILCSGDTITLYMRDGKFLESECSHEHAILTDYPLDAGDKKDLRAEIIELVSGNSRINIWRGLEGGSNLYFAVRNENIVHLKHLEDVIESLNSHNEILCIDYDTDVE